ncbi:MAG: PAS domain-containing protein, partial [Bacteroidales bacterium]
FYETLSAHERLAPPPGSLLWAIEKNNETMNGLLEEIKPVFRAYLQAPSDETIRTSLSKLLQRLEAYTQIYTLKENVLFPVIEKNWTEYRCVQLMWAFHDEIRSRLHEALEMLQAPSIDFSRFNRIIGDIFFYMKTIQFRDERILFPEMLATFEPSLWEPLLEEAVQLGFPYFTPHVSSPQETTPTAESGFIDLGTGQLSPLQIQLLFNHLPVDITYVDENDEVRFFSNPRKRIFPRTLSIIGRKVQNCHPPDSVHIVQKIVDSFRKGEKDQATFWIKMKDDFIFIQYFAVRDSQGYYRGVVEVTQEISEIKGLEGEKRLLDW